MSTILTLAGASFTNSLGKRGPLDPAAFLAVAFLGDASAAAFDVTTGGVISPSGAPVYNANYAALAATDQLDTGARMDGSAGFTLIGVFRYNSANGTAQLLTTAQLGDAGYQGFVYTSSPSQLNFGYNNAGSVTTLLMNGFRNNLFGFYAARMSATGVLDLWAGAGGLLTKQSTSVAMGTYYPDNVGTLKLSSLTGGFPKAVDGAYAALYKSALTDLQVQSQYDLIRAFFDTRLPNTL